MKRKHCRRSKFRTHDDSLSRPCLRCLPIASKAAPDDTGLFVGLGECAGEMVQAGPGGKNNQPRIAARCTRLAKHKGSEYILCAMFSAIHRTQVLSRSSRIVCRPQRRTLVAGWTNSPSRTKDPVKPTSIESWRCCQPSMERRGAESIGSGYGEIVTKVVDTNRKGGEAHNHSSFQW